MIKKLLKYIASLSPRPLTKNEYYDRLTEQIIRKVCTADSVCVDVGANEGKILQLFIKCCPKAIHYAFEPLPRLYFLLKRKFGSAANVYKVALSNTKGTSPFVYTIADAAYSGFIERSVTAPFDIEVLTVETDCLDNIIPQNVVVSLIKIDVEGAEYKVLEGASKTILKDKPFILFEFGKGGADEYSVSPEAMFTLMQSFGLKINLLKSFLQEKPPLLVEQFRNEFIKGKEYFFIAYP